MKYFSILVLEMFMFSFPCISRVIVCVAAFTVIVACEQTVITETATPLTDAKFFETAKITTGTVWYKNSDAFLGRTAKSGHPQPFMRTRYNAIAAAQLDASGKVKAGTTFPEGSVLTKDLVNTDKTLFGYALMWKRKSDPNADKDGWVWSELTSSGGVLIGISQKGSACISCHSNSGQIDKTLMNVSVP
jgi:hypothetical protein